MRRRLLIITDEMEVGGTQRQIVELARHIDSSSFEVDLVYFRNDSPYVDELKKAGVKVHHIPKRWKVDPGFFQRLARLVREGEYDVIHAFSFSGEAWGWLANLVSGRARFVSSARSIYEWYGPLQWALKRLITLNSAALVANSKAGAEYAALRMGVRRNSVQVVYNGMQLPEAFSSERLREERNDGMFRVLFVGRLVEHKNLACLLRAFRKLRNRVPHAHLDIVGDGPERELLAEQANKLGLGDGLTFHGARTDVVNFLKQADAFACTSHREGLCNAIMEAMAARLPVVASNVGGNSELVVHEETGFLFPPDDDETLADMLAELAGDPGKCARFGNNGHERMRRGHDPRRMATEMERIYERCLLQDNACAVQR